MLDLSPSFHFTGAQFVHVSRRWSYSTHILTHNPYRAQCQACTPLSLMWQITAASVPLVMDRFLRSPLLLYLSTLRFIQRNLIHPNTFSFCSSIFSLTFVLWWMHRAQLGLSILPQDVWPEQPGIEPPTLWLVVDLLLELPSYSCPFVFV